MMNRWIQILMLMACLAGFAGPAGAGTLSMAIDNQTVIDGGRLEIGTRVCNQGNAEARGVSLLADFAGRRAVSETAPAIAPGACRDFRVVFPLPAGAAGSFPVALVTRFHDDQGSPYNALSCPVVAVGKWQPPLVTCEVPAVLLTDDGALDFILKNRTDGPLPLRARLLLPGEFFSDTPPLAVQLPGGGALSGRFHIQNRFARGQARYPVFLIVEYVNRGTNGVTVAKTLLQVDSMENGLWRFRWVLLWIVPVIGLCLIVLQRTPINRWLKAKRKP